MLPWTNESLSSAMGVASIACWIVAQAPQFWENYRSKTCDGLAFHFLLNWLAGDLTNLIGCLLTDQKAFQTWLAAYFCLSDILLTAQYIYYQNRSHSQHVESHSASHLIDDQEPHDVNSALGARTSTPDLAGTDYGTAIETERAGGKLPKDHTGAAQDQHINASPETGSRTSRSGRNAKQSGVVFMGVWALIGFGLRTTTRPTSTSVQSPVQTLDGSVLSAFDASGWSSNEELKDIEDEGGLYTAGSDTLAEDVIEMPFAYPESSGRTDSATYNSEQAPVTIPREDSKWTGSAMKQLIGRIAAWTCTTLYLTSRIPQIWKNYQRKSVEGLSILLFVFAFGGNLTYVLSILLNPSGHSVHEDTRPGMREHYLLEALPYLLGSGGTLLFDLAIMAQSFIYGSARPIDEIDQDDLLHPSDPRKASTTNSSRRLIDEERAPLISDRAYS